MAKEKLTSGFINYSLYEQAEDIKRLMFITSCIRQSKIDDPRILDVGCGNGNISFQLANEGYKVTAIDLSAETIEHARSIHGHANIRYETKSIEDFNASDKFDIIICSEVLEHLQAPFPILSKINACLTSDGVAIITIPNGYGPRELFITRPVQKLLRDTNSLGYKLLTKFKRGMGYTGTTVQSSAHNLEHVQFFKLRDMYRFADELQMTVIYKGASNFLEKVFPFSLLAKRSAFLQQLDCRLADLLPLQWSSGFFLVLGKNKK